MKFQNVIGNVPPHVKLIGNLPDGGRFSRFIVFNTGHYYIAVVLALFLNLLLNLKRAS